MKKEPPKLHVLKPCEKSKQVEELRGVVKNIQAILPELVEYRRDAYLKHIEAGFTEAQALELCKSVQL